MEEKTHESLVMMTISDEITPRSESSTSSLTSPRNQHDPDIEIISLSEGTKKVPKIPKQEPQ